MSNPAHKIGKVGIQVPGIDDMKYWKKVKTAITNPSHHKDKEMDWCLTKGVCTTTKTLEGFEETAVEYLDRYFSHQRVISFPPHQIIEDKEIKKVAIQFENVLKEEFVSSGRGVILISPNIKYHSDLISSKVQFNCRDSAEHSLMIFVEELSLVLVVRIAKTASDISTQISNCRQDISEFISIHGHRIKEEKLTIIGTIACPSVERKDLKDVAPFQFADFHAQFYETMFISKDELECSDSFTDWLEAGIKSIEESLDINLRCLNTESKIFNSLVSQHMVSMATIQEGLPTISDNNVKQLGTIFLTPRQFKCISSRNNKKLIIGPFGSGKSLTGQSLLTNLTNSGIPGTAFYINCDNSSLMDSHIKECIKPPEDSRVICGSLFELYSKHVSKDYQLVGV